MDFKKTVYINNDTLATQAIGGDSTVILTVDTTAYANSTTRVFKIEYLWGDGTTDTVLYKPNKDYTNDNDIGDPRNFPQTHVFSIDPDKDFIKNDIDGTYNYTSNYNVVVKIYSDKNIDGPDIYNIFLILVPNSFETPISQLLLNNFSNIHLVKTKMIGPENHMLYVFELTEPNTDKNKIFLSLVNWKKKIPSPIKPYDLNRDYSFNLPFFDKLKNNLDAQTVNYTQIN